MMIHIFRLFHQISDYQIVQKNLNSVEINIVKGPDFTNNHEKKITTILNHHCGKEVKVIINYLKNIQRTKGGKKRMILVNLE